MDENFSADKAFFCSNPWDYKGKQRSMRENTVQAVCSGCENNFYTY